MLRPCKQIGRLEELGESWEEFLAEDDEAKSSENLKMIKSVNSEISRDEPSLTM